MVMLFFLVVVNFAICLSAITDAQLEVEINALFAIYNSTNGDFWLWRDELAEGVKWNFSRTSDGVFLDNPCSSGSSNKTWQGLSCSYPPSMCTDSICHVTTLSLRAYNLKGIIPCDIGNLSLLSILNLDNNQLEGPIPSELSNLSKLKILDLDFNQLSGPIPREIGNLTLLEILDLGPNKLTGLLPSEIGNLTLLEFVSLGDNQFTGPILSEIGKLTLLRILDLGPNELTGPIPAEVGNLTVLESLDLGGNQLTGPISPEIGKLVLLETLSLDINHLTGSIPVEIFSLLRLEWVTLGVNQLTGTIPREICNLTLLEILDLGPNLLTGPVPAEISKLSHLVILDLFDNQLTGPIPSAIGNLATLEILGVGSNMLTGAMPQQLGNLVLLEFLGLGANQLTGSVSNELSNLAHLEILDVRDNHLTGPIPSQIFGLSVLDILDLSANQLTGPLPTETGNLTLLGILDLSSNRLTGPIPSVIDNLAFLSFLDLSDNEFTGYLPNSFGCLNNLVTLFLHNNVLSGSIGNIFNYSAQLVLENIDMSNNLLSGSLSGDVFLLPALKVLALSVNCFESELSPNMCRASKIEVLSLNGLRSAESCKNAFQLPLSGVYLFNTIGGAVPECVWGLRNLTVLHLTGNGLIGEIGPSLPSYSRLVDLSLSHNQLQGAIPLDVLMIPTVDLSYNQLEGEIPSDISFMKHSSATLEINRLSGGLPVSVLESVNVSYLNILRGNLFSCDSIPENDEFRDFYTCGSETLDEALYIFGSILTLCSAVLVIFLASTFSLCGSHESVIISNVHKTASSLWKYATYMDKLKLISLHEKPHILQIIALADVFRTAMRLFIRLAMVCFVVSLPLYIVLLTDSDSTYSTHTNTYTWFWTLSFMSGVLPAGLSLLSWIAIVSICFFNMILLPMSSTSREGEMRSLLLRDQLSFSDKDSTTHSRRRVSNRNTSVVNRVNMYSAIACKVLFNAAVASAVNVAYISAIQQDVSPSVQFSIQLSVALFRLMYSQIAIPELTKSVTDPAANIDFRYHLLTVSNVIIPCVVTILASPSCFQGLLIRADSVSTPYSYEVCTVTQVSEEGNICAKYTLVEVDTAPVTPSFTYNNQCTSVLLTAYIPVIILGAAIQLLLCFLIPLFFASVERMCFNHKAIVYRQFIKGIFWTNFWLDSDVDVKRERMDHLENNPTTILDPKSAICLDILNNLMLMLTFGLCSPFVVFAITCVVVSKMNMWILLIGRFTSLVSEANSENETHYALAALSRVYISLTEVFERSFWLLAWCSSIFVALICWDIAEAGDVGWLESLWIPILAVTYPAVLWTTARYYERGCNRSRDEDNCNEETINRKTETELVAAICYN